MGYTHYWERPIDITKDLAKALPNLRDVVARHKDLIAAEENMPDIPAIVSVGGIRFNGIGEEGHETFYVPRVCDSREEARFSFCKTARKPYDIAVCECLLVLLWNCKGFALRSDGIDSDTRDFDAAWPKALENVKREYGYDFTFRKKDDDWALRPVRRENE